MAKDSISDSARAFLVMRVALAAKELRAWDAIGALTSGNDQDARDAQIDINKLDDALADAVRAGAIRPESQAAPDHPVSEREIWLAAFGASVAWQVSRECNRGLNAVEAFDREAGGTLTVEGVADHARCVADVAVQASLKV